MLQNKYKGIKLKGIQNRSCTQPVSCCSNASELLCDAQTLEPTGGHRDHKVTAVLRMRTKSRRWPIWSVTNYCGYSGTDGPAAEADGTGETDWIPVPSDPSVPSWFRETPCERIGPIRTLINPPPSLRKISYKYNSMLTYIPVSLLFYFYGSG